MAFDPKKFIDISKELQGGSSEAHYRSIINRSYYGVFGYIRNSLGIISIDGSVHQETYKALINSVAVSHKKAGKRLELLFKRRKEADYNHNMEIKKFTCEGCITDAEEIIKLFESEE
jgi:uncharacterized protein (UPF0332 family)